MMHSDYYALSSCAIGVVFIPFMVVCLLRYGLLLQAFNYSNRAYFTWLGCSFVASAAPLAAICIMTLLWQAVLSTYLTHTAATELNIILGYAALMLVGIAAVGAAFGRFCRVLGRAGSTVPRIEDRRLLILFTVSSLIAGVLVLLLNILLWQQWIYFVPLLTPLLIPAVNCGFHPYPGRVLTGVGIDAEPLRAEELEAVRIESGTERPLTRPELQQEIVSQDTRRFERGAAEEDATTGRQVLNGKDQDDRPAGGD